MIRSVVTFAHTLPALPDERSLTMKLFYFEGETRLQHLLGVVEDCLRMTCFLRGGRFLYRDHARELPAAVLPRP